MANIEEKVGYKTASIFDDMNRSILNRVYERDGVRYLVYSLPEKPRQSYKLARLNIEGKREIIEVPVEELINYTRQRSDLEDYPFY